jgi:class 3 adenylate cyclase
VSEGVGGVRTFLIADVRGYSRYTEDFGDEAAARLTAKFAELVAEDVEARGGEVVELRGDEALAVFTSARQAIRTAVELQAQFEAAEDESGLPLRVGIGIDSGEAVPMEGGGYRGAALNIAARLCARSLAGEVIVTDATSRLAGRLEGIRYSDRGSVRLKNIPDPIHVHKVSSEADAPAENRWVLMFFGNQRRSLSWKLGAVVALIAAGTAAAVVYLTAGDPGSSSAANPPQAAPASKQPAAAGLDSVVPAALWQACSVQTVPNPRADETAVCSPASGVPDRWEISRYPNGLALTAAYKSELGKRTDIKKDSGSCDGLSWGGEGEWSHGPGKPAGRLFCYFDGNDAVIVWTHERLGQPTHRDILVIAREGGSDHPGLARWWRPWHHQIGKAQ